MRKKQVQDDDCSDDDNIPKDDPIESLRLKDPTDDEHAARGRSFAKKPNSIAGRLRSRSRHRSLSVSRRKGVPSNPPSNLSSSSKENHAHQLPPSPTASGADAAATAPLPGEPITGISRAAAILNRHERALKTELLQLVDYQEKEIKYWKERALKKDVRDMISEPEAWEEKKDQPQSFHASLQNLTGDTNSQVAALTRELTNLRRILETQEKSNEDRVQMLESQIEKLIEAQAERVALLKSSKKNKSSVQDGSSLTNLRHSTSSIVSDGTGGNEKDPDETKKDPDNEVAVLEQLLARVLAEKDRLWFENQDLRNAVMETKEKEGPSSEGTLYQLSCRKCSGQNFLGNTNEDLRDKTMEHFSVIWSIVKTYYGKGHIAEEDIICPPTDAAKCNFRSSSLAHHLAFHCKDFANESEVKKWCTKNVKLERIKSDPNNTLRGREF